jgi:macrolide transport system ATP-binding/permease protein
MQTLLQDLRYGARMLLKNPGFTFVAIMTLALGIGANTAIFSLVDKLLVRWLPVREPGELVLLSAESINPRFLNTIFSHPDYLDFRDRNEVLTGLIAFIPIDGKLESGEKEEQVNVELVSGNYFEVLGVQTGSGRAFLPEEDQTPGTHPVAVLSYGFWQRRFGGDLDLIGKTVKINNVPLTVIGVASRGFTGTRLEGPVDLFAPLMMRPQLRPGGLPLSERNAAWLRLLGRLKPGVTQPQAQASLDLLARQIREANMLPSTRGLPFNERRMMLESGGRGVSILRTEMSGTLKLLMTIGSLLLLSACANLASLLLVRSAARRKEIALRLALGASRSRLIAQLMTESLLLVLPGASAGLLVAPWLYDLLLAFQPRVSLAQSALGDSLDGRVLIFTLLISLLSALLFGLLPALQSAGTDLVTALKDTEMSLGRRARHLNLRQLLVVGQIALTLVMLVGGGLFIKTLRNLLAIEPGFNTEKVLRVPLELPRQKYNAEKSNQFYSELSAQVKALPGVEAVSFASRTPLDGGRSLMSIVIEGYQTNPGENIGVAFNQAGPGYHEMMGIPIIEGRGFTEQDGAGAPGVVIINEALAQLYFPNQDALGKRLSRGPDKPWLEIIGVTPNIRLHELTESPAPQIDLPGLQHPPGNYAKILIRTTNEAAGLTAAVRREVQQLDPGVSIPRISTLFEELLDSIAPARMAATLTNLFGLTALLLAAIGLYGVMAFAVRQRRREIGIRMALGARKSDVLRMVVRQGMKLALIGVAIGLLAAFALTSLISKFLYGVSATDPLTFAAIALLLMIVALLACYIPARRATKVDPCVALRYE